MKTICRADGWIEIEARAFNCRFAKLPSRRHLLLLAAERDGSFQRAPDRDAYFIRRSVYRELFGLK